MENILEETRFIMKKYNIKANKNLGQNFLINEEVVTNIVDCSNIDKQDLVIEIGPGLGTLTKYLLEKAGKVICIELDTKMLQILKDRFSLYNNFELINNDVLKVDLKNIDIKQIDLMKTVDKNTCLNKKIAPGTSGNFNILLDTNKDSKYKIYFQSVNEKPQNLYFKAIKDGKEIAKTQTLEELSEKLDGNIVKKEKIKINIQWYWNFENNKANSDIQDTEDSKKIKRYQFNLYALGEEI